ncbi:acetyltransferase [Paraburkholderia sp. SARCC-3016]|uniref:acetyltransferase n=1 Tax=Paraburkholderia sp. SARCC-3016 TaxID=3058611 RepID=UPI002808DBE7|nr:acetyltransferase [Paraburkholderia sp. SARCC-3016]MDQ7980678.1 acetyltransferase [Paraburkholderia sp. SARCC-3016]
MTQFDVFNGDADGLFALHQLRLATPRAAALVTGTKEDVQLLARVPAQSGDRATVLDISLDTNRAALQTLLARGVEVEYFDHHFAGEIPRHARLAAHIDPSADICTSLIVDRHLGGRYRCWAVAAAYGDNLAAAAHRIAAACGLDADREQRLGALGRAVNYNAYGDSIDDLIVSPATLYRILQPYADPFDFLEGEALVRQIEAARATDLSFAWREPPLRVRSDGDVYVLPEHRWARRVRGEFANALASAAPSSAHAVLSPRRSGDYAVSVRAPLARPGNADRLCRRFGGNGRARAAGVTSLARERLDEFISAFYDDFKTSK